MMKSLWHDLRYGVRALAKNPGYSLLAVLALGLGIGANTAVFSVADAFLLRPFPFRNLSRLVRLENTLPAHSAYENSVSAADFYDWRAQSHSFEQLAGYEGNSVNLTGQGRPQSVLGAQVTANFFATLGANPFLGRAFLPHEDRAGRDREVVLSYGLWQRAFGSDPGLVGKTIRLNGASYTVVGILGKGLNYPTEAELWIPLVLRPPADPMARQMRELFVLGLRTEGVSTAQTRAEMQGIAQRLAQLYPATNQGVGVRVLPLAQYASGDLTREYTLLLLCAVGFVLLIACANVANLQFARGAARSKEIAIRAVLGAGRWRVIRQVLTENLALGAGGALLGLLLAEWGVSAILGNMPADVARFVSGWGRIGIDSRALLFTIGIAMAAAVLSGLAPAWQASKVDLNKALKEGGRTSAAGAPRHGMRNALVVAQIALAIVLVLGAGLMVKGVRALHASNEQFAPSSLLTVGLELPYGSDAKIRAFYDRVLERAGALPGAQSAALVTKPPFADQGDLNLQPFSIGGRPPVRSSEAAVAEVQSISPNYLRTIHIPLLQGREFNAADGPDSRPVAIVSAKLARLYWPKASPLGQRIKVGSAESQNPWRIIVGIAGDIKSTWITADADPELYLPYQQSPPGSARILVRTAGDAIQLAAAMREPVASADPDQPISEIKTLAQVIHESLVGLSYVAVMLAIAGVIAISLATIGVYGVMAYAVGQRRHEIGVRMALGAQEGDVLQVILGQGLLLTLLGVAIGLPAAMGLANVLAGMLFGVRANDPEIFLGVTLLLFTIALLACYVPARRAMRVHPVEALRYE